MQSLPPSLYGAEQTGGIGAEVIGFYYGEFYFYFLCLPDFSKIPAMKTILNQEKKEDEGRGTRCLGAGQAQAPGALGSALAPKALSPVATKNLLKAGARRQAPRSRNRWTCAAGEPCPPLSRSLSSPGTGQVFLLPSGPVLPVILGR